MIGIGMTMVILTGGIDLSVGSLIALCAVLIARLMRDYGGGSGGGPGAMVLACAAGLAVCALAGVFNGLMITVFRVPPFIVTLAVMQIARGLAYEWSEGQSINQVPAAFVWLGRGRGILGIPNTVLLMGALYAVAQVVMARMTIGRYIYAIGGNREGAFYAAVPVKRVLVFVYTVCGLLAGLGGVVEASRLQSGAPTYGQSAELAVIAAVVVGGASLTGGRGSILGTLVGALIIAVIENGMNLTKVGSYRQMVVLGCVTLGAVLIDQLRHRRTGKT
jgi:ribose transport system permease protein